MNIAQMPSKFRNLVLLEDEVAVPTSLCLGVAELSRLYENVTQVIDAAAKILDRVGRTSGAFLVDDLVEIEGIVAGLRTVEAAESVLAAILRSTFGRDGLDGAFAVRSANTIEDSASRSFAGLHETFLHVEGCVALLGAIRAVWMSAYSRAVITERIHAGLLDAANPMNVIIQRMVPATYAGVAFSRDPVTGEDTIYVEIVEGVGDSLVSGRKAGHRHKIDRGRPASGHHREDRRILEAVTAVLHSVERRLAGPVDIEWAWDGEVAWLLQARPITTLQRSESRDEPVLLVTDLYGDDMAMLDRIRPLPDFAAYFRDKRKRMADFARRQDLGRAVALILRMNYKAVEQAAFRRDVVGAFASDQVILDFSPGLRQIILPRERLVDELATLMSDRNRLHTIVVRDFIQGDAGIITHMAPGDGTLETVVGEWSAEGLLAINRGTATTQIIRLTALESDAAGLPGATTRRLFDATVAARAAIGPVQIEWVTRGETLYPLDFSPLSERAAFAEPGSGTVISRGYAFAPTLVLDDDRDLRLLSIAPSVSLTNIPEASQMGPAFDRLMERIGRFTTAPIVVSSRPLAALAPLLPHVSGFVFEHAAILSHLSILIREKGLPAVQSADVYTYARSRKSLLINLGAEISISSPDDAVDAPLLSHHDVPKAERNSHALAR